MVVRRPCRSSLPAALALTACYLVIVPAAADAAVVVGSAKALQRAVNHARPGQTVLVRRGTYPRLTLAAGRRLRRVTVRPYRRARVVLRGVTIGRHAGGLRIRGLRITDYTQITDARRVWFARNRFSPHGIAASGRRLRFEENTIHDLSIHRDPAAPGVRCNRFSNNAGIAPRCGTALRLSRASGVVIRRNRFQRIPVDGIQMLEMRNTLIEENLFEDVKATIDPYEHAEAIQMLGESDRVTIRRNLVRRARGLLAQTFKGRGAQRRLVIENNVFVQGWHWGIKLFDAPGARISGNTIWDTGGRGIALEEDSSEPTQMTGAVVANNVVGVLRADPRTMAFEDYNLVGDGTHGGAHDLGMREPGFANRDRGDYRLAPGSPGIDRGLAALAPRWDIFGARRVGAPDIGAYEYGGVARR